MSYHQLYIEEMLPGDIFIRAGDRVCLLVSRGLLRPVSAWSGLGCELLYVCGGRVIVVVVPASWRLRVLCRGDFHGD